jgi:dihydrofolate reductase
MRKIGVFENISLDGFFAGPNGEIDFFKRHEELAEYAAKQASRENTILFGRVTYELMASYWPTASPQTENPVLIDAMNNSPKIVFSRTLKKAEWKNTTVIKDNIADEILKMKQQPGKDMIILGSGSIVRAFADLGLIDEYHLSVHPIVLGKGKPLFQNIKNRLNLKLVKAETFKAGVVILDYELVPKEARNK